MDITDDEVQNFQKLTGEDISFEDAKQRYRELLHLYWILAHCPPKEGEPPYDPPIPPWI